MDLSVFAPVLTSVCRDVEAAFGPDVWLDPIERHERLFSFLLRARVCDKGSTSPRSHIFLKIGKTPPTTAALERHRSRALLDYETMGRVYARMSDGLAFGAVRPIASYPEQLAVVTEQVDGETLLERLQREVAWSSRLKGASDLMIVLERTGQWISAFQKALPPREQQSAAQMAPYIDARLRLMAEGRNARDTGLRDRVLRHVAALSEEAGGVEPGAVAVHADLSPSNVIVSSGRIVVLDFAMTRLGHPLQDAARLFTQLDLLKVKPQFRSKVIDELQTALLRGFAPGLSRRDPAFRIQVLSQRVNHLASLTTRRYGWREAAYNFLVKRNHSHWIERELRTPAAGPSTWA